MEQSEKSKVEQLLQACRMAVTVLTIMNVTAPDPRADQAIQELQRAMEEVEGLTPDDSSD